MTYETNSKDNDDCSVFVCHFGTEGYRIDMKVLLWQNPDANMERKPPSCTRKMLNTYYQIVVSLSMSDEEEVGNAEEQPFIYNLMEWSEGIFPYSYREDHSKKLSLRKLIRNIVKNMSCARLRHTYYTL